ncbi:MAG: SpoIIE family protein phosphatase [Candidatus Rokubacteria bacterium]|nr:SpoIIE family protein phosphatase [Candidatus Rokubacteria bacterium]
MAPRPSGLQPMQRETLLNQTILVIDDDHEVASTLADFLEEQGYRVLVAHSAAEATTQLEHATVSAVLLDLHLPDADGIDLMGRFLALPSDVAVVVLTGHATLESALAAVQAGAAGYLLKPVSFDSLATVLGRAIERRGLIQENARLSADLADRLTEAEALLAIASTVASTLDLDEALRRISRELVRLTGADIAAAYLLDSGREVLVPCAAYHVPKEHLEQLATSVIPLREEGFHLPLWKDRRPVWSDNVAADSRFHHALFRLIPHQSALVLPLILETEVAGAFYAAWWKRRRRFTEEELGLLERVCAQVSVLLRNVRLFGQAKAYNEAFRELVASELRIARKIQWSALPHDFGSLGVGTGLEVHAMMEPAREVGGDLYDVLRLPGERLFVVLGDVSGKGIPAAMFMMVATALLRVAARDGLEAPELLARLNDQLCADNPTSMFVTLACAAVDGAAGTARYAIAGHTTPVLLTAAGEPRLLGGDPGTIAGVEPGLVFPSATVLLNPGDTLLFYSDGVTESFDPNGRAFGEEGLLAALVGLAGASARAVVERLREAVRLFTVNAEPSDDIAILAVRRLGTLPLVLDVPADPRAVMEATDRLRAWCRAEGISVAATHDLALALEEMGTNVAIHALARRPGATFRVRLARAGGEAVLEIRDPGPPFNPLEAPPPVIANGPADQPVGGLGIQLVRGVMTHAAWVRDGAENVLTLARALDG